MVKALLSDMVLDLRAEAGHSLLLGQGTNMEDTLKYYLRRTQRELYVGFDWPQFMVNSTVDVDAGDRYLTNLTEIDKEQVNQMWAAGGTGWVPMAFGIGPEQFNSVNSNEGAQGGAPRRYAYSDPNDAFELWPIPSEATQIMVQGQTLLPSLVANSDRSLLDGQLIVLFAASTILARQKDEDAPMVLNKAQQFLVAIQKQNGSQKRATRTMAGPSSYANGGRYPRAGV